MHFLKCTDFTLLKARLLPSKKFPFISFNESSFKVVKMVFIPFQKLFLHLHFCPDFFDYVGKRLDKKAKVSFKLYNVTEWKTNNYNSHVAQYLKN